MQRYRACWGSGASRGGGSGCTKHPSQVPGLTLSPFNVLTGLRSHNDACLYDICSSTKAPVNLLFDNNTTAGGMSHSSATVSPSYMCVSLPNNTDRISQSKHARVMSTSRHSHFIQLCLLHSILMREIIDFNALKTESGIYGAST